MKVKVLEQQSLTQANWENLLDLYRDIQSKTEDVKIGYEPLLNFSSFVYAWPNFSIVSESENNLNDQIVMIDRAIIQNQIPSILLLNPLIQCDVQLSASLERFSIRQIDQWPVIYYDMNQGLPRLTANPDLEIELVTNKQALADWHLVARKMLFKDKQLPVSSFLTQDYILLVGYLDSEPVASTLLFVGSEVPSVHMVAVLPQHMKKGIGKSIFSKALEISADLKAKRVFAQASQMGTKPWLELGFKISGYIYIFWKVGYIL